jgi:phosphoserine phosphatase
VPISRRDRKPCWNGTVPFSKAELIAHLSGLRLAPGKLQRLKAAGITIALVSITRQCAVEWLATALGADYAVGTGWCEDDTLNHFRPEDIANYLNSLLAELNMTLSSLHAVGDSCDDVPMLNFAARSYFVGEIRPQDLLHSEPWPDANIEDIIPDRLKWR